MKVTFKNMVGGYTGTVDEIIFYWDPRLQRVLARRKPVVTITDRHRGFGIITANLMALSPSEGYRNDLRAYAERCYALPEFGRIRPIWNNLFYKLMFAQKRLVPALDLATITKTEIYTLNLPCKSVQTAVEAGLLPPVRDYASLWRLI